MEFDDFKEKSHEYAKEKSKNDPTLYSAYFNGHWDGLAWAIAEIEMLRGANKALRKKDKPEAPKMPAPPPMPRPF